MSTLADRSIKQKVINLFLSKFLQSLLGKGLDALHIRQLKRQNIHSAAVALEWDSIIRILCGLDASGSENYLVWLTLAQELLDSFKALE